MDSVGRTMIASRKRERGSCRNGMSLFATVLLLLVAAPILLVTASKHVACSTESDCGVLAAANVNSWPRNELTFTAWVKQPTVTQEQANDVFKAPHIITYATSRTDREFSLFHPENIIFWIANSDSNYYAFWTGIDLTSNPSEWQFVAFTLDSTATVKGYFRDEYLWQFPLQNAAGFTFSQGGSVTIGNHQEGKVWPDGVPAGRPTVKRAFVGLIQDVHIFKQALPHDEILAVREGLRMKASEQQLFGDSMDQNSCSIYLVTETTSRIRLMSLTRTNHRHLAIHFFLFLISVLSGSHQNPSAT